MKITLNHENGHVWHPLKRKMGGTEYFVLSNKNVAGFEHAEKGGKDLSNRQRFHVYVPDERSVLNCIHAGMAIRMTGIGNNGTDQENLFNGDRILFDGEPAMQVEPPRTPS